MKTCLVFKNALQSPLLYSKIIFFFINWTLLVADGMPMLKEAISSGVIPKTFLPISSELCNVDPMAWSFSLKAPQYLSYYLEEGYPCAEFNFCVSVWFVSGSSSWNAPMMNIYLKILFYYGLQQEPQRLNRALSTDAVNFRREMPYMSHEYGLSTLTSCLL